jgi:hypothetical protein
MTARSRSKVRRTAYNDRTAHWVALNQIASCRDCVTDQYWTTPVEAQCQWTDGIQGEYLHAPTNKCRGQDIDSVVTQFCELTTPAAVSMRGRSVLTHPSRQRKTIELHAPRTLVFWGGEMHGLRYDRVSLESGTSLQKITNISFLNIVISP